MIRMLLYMLAAIFAITLVRIFVGIIARGLSSYLGAGSESSGQASSASRDGATGAATGARRQGVLRKDSLTGVYIAEEIAVTKVINGQTHYFASEENLRDYLQRAPSGA